MLSQMLGGPESFQLVRDRARALLAAQPGVVFPLKPGALALLALLRARGVPCAVASSTGADEVRRRLAAVGVLDYFQALSEAAEAKPARLASRTACGDLCFRR